MNNENHGPKVKIKPPLAYVSMAIIGILIQLFFEFQLSIPMGLRVLIGFVIISISGIIQLSSLKVFKNDGRKPTPHLESKNLFISGPYRFMRNPMYVSAFLLQFGIGIIINILWVTVFAFAGLAIVHFLAVLPEEEYLKSKFGESYLNYMQNVRRYALF